MQGHEELTIEQGRKEARQVNKSIRWMPWHRQARKDVEGCDKLWGGAQRPMIRRYLNGATRREQCPVTPL